MMLQDNTIKLKFDNSYNGRLFAVQGDTGRTYKLQVLTTMNNVLDVSGMKLRLYIGNDKEVSYADGKVTSPEEGKFKVQVYNSQLKYAGLQKAQFVLTDKDGQKVGSKVFDLYVEEGLETGASLGKNIIVDFEAIDETLKLIKDYDKTLEEAKEIDRVLKMDIQEGTETRQALADCKRKALEIKDQLETSKTDAGKTLQDLKTTKAESESVKTDLESENTKTGKNIQTLTEKTEAGNKTIAGLGQSIEKASSTEASLKNTDTKAQGTKTEIEKLLGESKNTEQALKEIIASGDLDKYITDPKLQEALAAYATKEDLKGIDVTDQLKDYTKTVDMTSALAGKVDVKSGYGLSKNDYTDAAKAKVDAIPTNPKYTDTKYDDTQIRRDIQALKDRQSPKTDQAEKADINFALNQAGYFSIRNLIEDGFLKANEYITSPPGFQTPIPIFMVTATSKLFEVFGNNPSELGLIISRETLKKYFETGRPLWMNINDEKAIDIYTDHTEVISDKMNKIEGFTSNPLTTGCAGSLINLSVSNLEFGTSVLSDGLFKEPNFYLYWK